MSCIDIPPGTTASQSDVTTTEARVTTTGTIITTTSVLATKVTPETSTARKEVTITTTTTTINGKGFCADYASICSDTPWPNCSSDFATIPVGFTESTSGNTQACRIYHLSVAQETGGNNAHVSLTEKNLSLTNEVDLIAHKLIHLNF